jgi:tRNA threonylcarbamoyladenosine biosynthesis protein TsaE
LQGLHSGADTAAGQRVRTTGPAETEALGAGLAARLKPGDVVMVAGELGAGKTTLVRGACRALNVTGPVTSPTFTIGQRYSGSVPVSHLDLFRVERLDQEETDLLSDYLDPDTVAFIEWPPDELWEGAGLPRARLKIRIEHAGGDERLIKIAPAEFPADGLISPRRSQDPESSGL